MKSMAESLTSGRKAQGPTQEAAIAYSLSLAPESAQHHRCTCVTTLSGNKMVDKMLAVSGAFSSVEEKIRREFDTLCERLL